MKRSLLTLVIILVLTSCSSESKNYILVSENSGGIKKGNPVVLKEQTVGKVVDVSIGENFMVNTEIELNQDLKLPDDTKFYMTSIDIFTKAVEIIPGDSKGFLCYGDTVHVELTKGISLDSVITTISDGINNSKPIKNQDSILIELQKLNKEVEKLNEK